MTREHWVLGGLGAAVALVNVATTRRVWASVIFERSQKIAQTVILWVVPGSFLVVRHVLGETRPRRRRIGIVDPTVDSTSFEAVSNDSSSGHGAHDGWGGGGHHGGGGDFGGGHG